MSRLCLRSRFVLPLPVYGTSSSIFYRAFVRWIEKSSELNGSGWTSEDYAQFKSEIFRSGKASNFLAALEDQLPQNVVPGLSMRVIPAGVAENDKLREAVATAASKANGEVRSIGVE